MRQAYRVIAFLICALVMLQASMAVWAEAGLGLGILGHSFPILGLLHGINALALFTAALLAGRGIGRTATVSAAVPSAPAHVGVR